MNLFNDNIDFVEKIVNRMYYGYGCKDDLLQAGLMGLYKACKNYREEENVKFTTYATYYIIGEIKKELRVNKLIKLNKKTYKIIKLIKENEGLSIEEIAVKYKIEKEELLNAYLYIDNITSLDKVDYKNGLNLITLIPDKTRKTEIIDAVESLDDESRKLIKLRYFKNYTQIELVGILGINQSKISRIEKKALQNLRKILLSK